MSRIHEALSRAKEEQGATTDPATPEPVEADAVTALAREPFPVELAAQRRKHGKTEPVTGRATESRPPVQETVETAQQSESNDSKATGRTIFERLDARLAEKVVADNNISPLSREQYRRLAGVLLDAQGSNGLRVVMVTSALPGEGKSLTASNLALTLSESYRRRVLLIDADLRKPALQQFFGITAASGLADGLDSGADGKLIVRQVSSTLAVLPAGRPTSDPMAVLTSERMRQLLEEAKDSFDWIIIDTPPLMLLPDAHLLSSLVDGAVLVIKARSTPHEMVKRTTDIIGRNRVLGVVLNQADPNASTLPHTYYGGYYLATREDQAQ